MIRSNEIKSKIEKFLNENIHYSDNINLYNGYEDIDSEMSIKMSEECGISQEQAKELVKLFRKVLQTKSAAEYTRNQWENDTRGTYSFKGALRRTGLDEDNAFSNYTNRLNSIANITMINSEPKENIDFKYIKQISKLGISKSEIQNSYVIDIWNLYENVFLPVNRANETLHRELSGSLSQSKRLGEQEKNYSEQLMPEKINSRNAEKDKTVLRKYDLAINGLKDCGVISEKESQAVWDFRMKLIDRNKVEFTRI